MRFFGSLPGVPYLDVLSAMHRNLLPTAYLEVGTWRGNSLRLASCLSVAIDPDFRIDQDVVGDKPALHLLGRASCDVYRSGTLRSLLPDGADLIFIDGLHLIEAVLDDIIGCESHASTTSVMVLHDILPLNVEMATRENSAMRSHRSTAAWWTGDVWKVVQILATYRPALRLTMLDSQPTGLLVIQGLDPTNTVLHKARDEILSEWQERRLDEDGLSRLHRDIRMTTIATTTQLASVIASLR